MRSRHEDGGRRDAESVATPEAGGSDSSGGYPLRMAETTLTLDQRLEGIGAQLAWVRDYL